MALGEGGGRWGGGLRRVNRTRVARARRTPRRPRSRARTEQMEERAEVTWSAGSIATGSSALPHPHSITGRRRRPVPLALSSPASSSLPASSPPACSSRLPPRYRSPRLRRIRMRLRQRRPPPSASSHRPLGLISPLPSPSPATASSLSSSAPRPTSHRGGAEWGEALQDVGRGRTTDEGSGRWKVKWETL